MSIKGIARKLSFSVNTVRKIIRRTHGYESDAFDTKSRFKGKQHWKPAHISDVDGEVLHIQKARSRDGYNRVSAKQSRDLVHIHEAKKVFRTRGLKWEPGFVVHHIDDDRSNFAAHNLSVFRSTSLHIQHHGRLARHLLHFVTEKNLLKEFYEKYPDLNLPNLLDILAGHDPFIRKNK